MRLWEECLGSPAPAGFQRCRRGCGLTISMPFSAPTAGTRDPAVLLMAKKTGDPPFDADDVAVTTGLATQAALALELATARQARDRLALLEDHDRIARDLHDLVIQQLFATGLGLPATARLALGRVARAGALADLLSKPVLIGYLAGIGITMIVSQLGKLTGVPVEGNSVPAEIGSWLIGLGRVHTPTVVLSALLLVMLLVGGWLRPNWPMPLISMLAATAVVATFSLQHHGIVVLGHAAIGIPALGVPHLSAADLSALALPALGVAVVAYSDNVLTARAFGARRSQTVDAALSWSRWA